MMEEQYPSVSCPSCRQNLLIAALSSFSYLRRAYCPYCGTAVRIALRPLALLIFGIASFSIGYYLLSADERIVVDGLPFPVEMIPVGLGILSTLLGLIFMRFLKIEPVRAPSAESTRAFYPYTVHK